MRLIKPSRLAGAVVAPSSKSFMQRAVLLSCFAKGPCELYSPARDADSLASIGVAKALGAAFEERDGRLVVTPAGAVPNRLRLECGESGFLLRSACALCALREVEFELDGAGSLLKRPIDMLLEPLSALGARVSLQGGRLPLRVKGPIKGAKLKVFADQTSQFLSGLLMALPLADGDSEIEVSTLSSRPYVELTVQLLHQFGLNVEHSPEFDRFWIPGGQQSYAQKIKVEGDWSSAAYILVAGALAGEITVSGLMLDSRQADREILPILEEAGARISHGPDWITVEQAPLRAFEIDCKSCPDLFPALAVLACGCKGKSRIYSTDRLRTKESSRAEVIAEELGKFGAQIEIGQDCVTVQGGKLKGGAGNSHGDHRIAMALGLAGLISDAGIAISGDDCVKKSYRNFFDDLSFCTEPI